MIMNRELQKDGNLTDLEMELGLSEEAGMTLQNICIIQKQTVSMQKCGKARVRKILPIDVR